MTTLNYQQVQNLWIANGGDPGWAPMMAGIAYAESGWNTEAYNGVNLDRSVGLWQINYYGSMREPRTAKYGSPEQLFADPNRQAAAAIDLLGDNAAGIGNWTNDATWVKWVAAGRPQQPTAATVQQWINAPNLPAGDYTTGDGNVGASVSSTGKYGCNNGSQGSELPLVSGRIGSACQLKALSGGLLVGVGFGLFVAGAVLVAMNTRIGAKVAGTAAGFIPGGGIVKGLAGSRSRYPRVTAETEAESRANYDARNPSPARQEATKKARSNTLGVMGYSMDDLASDLF